MIQAPMIQTQSLCKSFASDQVALRDVDLNVQRGEFVSIVGPSGCGKSTLLRLIAGLLSPSSGQLTVDGSPPNQSPCSKSQSSESQSKQRRVGFVFQDATLLPWRNVVDNIRLPLELQGAARQEQAEAVRQSLELIGLEKSDERKYPRMLSGGMRMRVSLARAMVARPSVLLLDEPFAALDDMLRSQLNEELLRIWSDRGWTTLFVTHNVSEAVFLSQRVLVMSPRPGTIAQQIEVPFSYPRLPPLRAEAKFAELAGRVSTHLREVAS